MIGQLFAQSADDYLPKPFAIQELVARVEALGRRYAEEPALNLRVGDLTLHLATTIREPS